MNDAKDLRNDAIVLLRKENNILLSKLEVAVEALKYYSHDGDFSYAPDRAKEALAKIKEMK